MSTIFYCLSPDTVQYTHITRLDVCSKATVEATRSKNILFADMHPSTPIPQMPSTALHFIACTLFTNLHTKRCTKLPPSMSSQPLAPCPLSHSPACLPYNLRPKSTHPRHLPGACLANRLGGASERRPPRANLRLGELDPCRPYLSASPTGYAGGARCRISACRSSTWSASISGGCTAGVHKSSCLHGCFCGRGVCVAAPPKIIHTPLLARLQPVADVLSLRVCSVSLSAGGCDWVGCSGVCSAGRRLARPPSCRRPRCAPRRMFVRARIIAAPRSRAAAIVGVRPGSHPCLRRARRDVSSGRACRVIDVCSGRACRVIDAPPAARRRRA